MNTSGFQTQKGEAIKTKKGGVNPATPIFIRLQLYLSILYTCTYLSKDENGENPLNENADPIVLNPEDPPSRQYVWYHPHLLKCWLNFLLQNKFWYRNVEVLISAKRSTNDDDSTNNKTQRTHRSVKCLYIPSTEEINNNKEFSKQDKKVYVASAKWIRRYLVDSPPPYQLTETLEAASREGYAFPINRVACVTTLCGSARLQFLGMKQAAPTNQWLKWYPGELARIRTAFDLVAPRSRSKSKVGNLTREEAEEYNKRVLIELRSTDASDAKEADVDDTQMFDRRMPGKFVSVSNIYKAESSGDVDREKKQTYKEMIKEYHQISGEMLDINAEKQNRTLDRRVEMIKRAKEFTESNPLAVFVHSYDLNRLMLHNPNQTYDSYGYSGDGSRNVRPSNSNRSVKAITNPYPRNSNNDRKINLPLSSVYSSSLQPIQSRFPARDQQRAINNSINTMNSRNTNSGGNRDTKSSHADERNFRSFGDTRGEDEHRSRDVRRDEGELRNGRDVEEDEQPPLDDDYDPKSGPSNIGGSSNARDEEVPDDVDDEPPNDME